MNRRLLLAVLGLCLVAAFAALGRWQLSREAFKRAHLAAAEAALAAPPASLAQALATPGADVARVQGPARFLGTPPLWLDNQRRGERVGVRLYCAADAGQGAPLLVDLGWLPLGADRVLPEVACPHGEQPLAGLLVPPPAVGLRLGPGLVEDASGRGWLATRVEPGAVAAAWRIPALAPRVLRLDPALPLGFERDLVLFDNTLPPERHRGYALQWFGLAAVTFVFTGLLTLRRRP